jgi:hypothetical protein
MERKQQLMQESLDAPLSAQAVEELTIILAENPQSADEYQRLQKVDDMLRIAPFERAPKRLALTIMARIAQTVSAQTKPTSDIDIATLQVAVQLVTVATLPLLVGAGYMLLNSQTDPEALEVVIEQVAMLLLMVINVIDVMLDEAKEVVHDDPQTALAMLTLLPTTLLTMVSEILGIHDDTDES